MDLDFTKLGGLVPAVIQDAASGEVLMLGFMNADAYTATQASGEVTSRKFHSVLPRSASALAFFKF